ncbi:MAG: glycosyltransferase family 2 protein [Candidatus Margulisiibacteriota bacterium]|jgi:hypothetical protein
MKIITLIPIKNEDWILDYTLKNISKFSDYIIVADQMSEDKSREICKKYEKVILLDNKEKFHSNKVRWQMLDAARNFEGNNFIFSIDADEFISPLIKEKLIKIQNNIYPGTTISFQWIQLCEPFGYYRNDGVWKNSFKPIAFWDNRKMNYIKQQVANDHVGRVPYDKSYPNIKIEGYPLLHLQFAASKKTQIRQAWYRCSELILENKSPRKINHFYRETYDESKAIKLPLRKEWLKEIELPDNLNTIYSKWRTKQIFEWFDEYGIEKFEPLQIWHIPELHDEFIKRINREPKSQIYPYWLIKMNDIKNKIKNQYK